MKKSPISEDAKNFHNRPFSFYKHFFSKYFFSLSFRWGFIKVDNCFHQFETGNFFLVMQQEAESIKVIGRTELI